MIDSEKLAELNEALIQIDYEVPPMRAIYRCVFHDEGQTKEEIIDWFEKQFPRRRVRKISRLRVERKDGEHE